MSRNIAKIMSNLVNPVKIMLRTYASQDLHDLQD